MKKIFKIQAWTENKSKLLIISFFVFYLAFGLAIVADYGISADETTERETSIRQYQFAVSKIYYLATKKQIPGLEHDHVWYQNYLQGSNNDRFYGTFLQWPSLILEHIKGFEAEKFDPEAIYLSRHILNFIYFYLALICFYLLLKNRFQKRSLALLGVILVAMTPRFFAEAFYNNKDILGAATYIITIYFGERLIKRSSWSNLLWFVLISAAAMNTRITALIVPAAYYLFLLIKTITEKNKKQRWQKIIFLILIPMLIFCLYIAMQPTAWGQEVSFVNQVIELFSHYDAWKGETLYFGKLIPWNNIPWHFIPGYFWATTPLLYPILILSGIGVFCYQLGQKWRNKKIAWVNKLFNLDNYMFCFWLLPWLATVICHSVLYNSWRHLYFIYFPLIYMAILGIEAIWGRIKLRKFLIFFLCLSFAITGSWMIKNHPYQFVYYNPLVRPYVAKNFERDYWSISAQTLFMKLLQENSEKGKIKVLATPEMQKFVNLLIPIKQRDNFLLTTIEEAQYAIVYFINWQHLSLTNGQYNDNLTKLNLDFNGWNVIDQVEVDEWPLALLLENPKVATEESRE